MPQESKIKTGDVVELKSGGPHMTVVCIENHNIVCQWFYGRLIESTFMLETLNVAPEEYQRHKAIGLRLKAGDVVCLASGGPHMTVSSCQDSKVTCQWFDQGLLSQDTLMHATLSLVSAKQTRLQSEMDNVAVGDVVRLNSGRKDMTVSHISDLRIVCQWFVDHTLHEGAFTHGTLLSPADLKRIDQEDKDRRRRALMEEEANRDHSDELDYGFVD